MNAKSRRAGRHGPRRTRALLIEPLEGRWLLSVDTLQAFPIAFGNVTLDLGNGPETIALSGKNTVSARVVFQGTQEGQAQDDDANGNDEVAASLTGLDLSGYRTQTVFGIPQTPTTVRLFLTPGGSSDGYVEENANATSGVLDVAPYGNQGAGTGVYDVSLSVDIGGQVYHAAAPLHLVAALSHLPSAAGEAFQQTNSVPWVDSSDNPASVSITSVQVTAAPQNPWHNPGHPLDVNNDGVVSAQDALQIINDINTNGSRLLPIPPDGDPSFGLFLDVDGDGSVLAQDVLEIISYLNTEQHGPPPPLSAGGELPAPGAEGEAVVQASPSAAGTSPDATGRGLVWDTLPSNAAPSSSPTPTWQGGDAIAITPTLDVNAGRPAATNAASLPPSMLGSTSRSADDAALLDLVAADAEPAILLDLESVLSVITADIARGQQRVL